MPTPDARAVLTEVLLASQAAGHLGPTPVADQIAHALAFAEALPGALPARAADLGSGGGVPGLVLAALVWPTAAWSLIEVRARRAAFLTFAIKELELESRVDVLEDRVEVLGRSPVHRSAYDLVTARSFGRPAVVAECGAALLKVGGALVVSEPPESPAGSPGARWPLYGLAAFGLEPPESRSGTPRFAVMRQVSPVPVRYPRRAARLAKDPHF